MLYGWILYKTGTRMQDYLKSQQYYVKSLSIDNTNGSAHNNYAVLLNDKLNNFDKAEYHFKKALAIDQNDAMGNYNFAWFLKNIQSKYNESLICINKACELEPNDSRYHELKGLILFSLNKFEESIDETIHALKLNELDGYMDEDMDDAKQLIEESINKYMKEELNIQTYINSEEFEGYKLIKWLYDNQLLSTKREIFANEISLSMLKHCTKSAVSELIANKSIDIQAQSDSMYSFKWKQFEAELKQLTRKFNVPGNTDEKMN